MYFYVNPSINNIKGSASYNRLVRRLNQWVQSVWCNAKLSLNRNRNFISYVELMRFLQFQVYILELFNLSAKLIDNKIGYMCSNLLISCERGVLLIPDPIKRIERLGKSLNMTSKEELKERYISFEELLTNYRYSRPNYYLE